MDCRPRARCRQYHICPACARIRQARIAARAEAIFTGQRDTYLTVITPDPAKGQSVPQIRRRFLRKRASHPNLGLSREVGVVGMGMDRSYQEKAMADMADLVSGVMGI